MILLALAAIGVWVIVIGICVGITTHRQQGWPRASGVVAESSFDRFTYEYQAGGSKQHGVRYGDVPRGKYAPGSAVTVYYDPANPAQSVLDPGSHVDTAFTIGFGVVWILFLAPFLLFFGALAYCDILLFRARYHMRKGLEALEEGQAIVNEIHDEHGFVPDELSQVQQQALARASAMGKELREVEDLLSDQDRATQ